MNYSPKVDFLINTQWSFLGPINQISFLYFLFYQFILIFWHTSKIWWVGFVKTAFFGKPSFDGIIPNGHHFYIWCKWQVTWNRLKDLQFFDAKFGLRRYQITKSIFGHLQSIWHVFKRYDELTLYSLCVMNQLINKS